MCLLNVGFSISDIIDSMETFQSENKQVLKDCCVVLVPLLDDVIRRRTVTVSSTNDFVLASKESSTLDLTVDNCTEKRDIKEINVLPISVFSKIDNGIITEVWCKRFRKRKYDVQLEMETDEEIILDVMKCMLDRITEKSVKTQSIDFSSPGIVEIELIKDFCRENGYDLNDYQDLEQLFTFRTLPLVEVTKLIKSRSSNKRKPKKKKSPTKRIEILRLEKNESIEISKTPPSNNFTNSGLEKIENLKIRKILEDFGRLSK